MTTVVTSINNTNEMALPTGMSVVSIIVHRELVRFVRQPARIAAAVGTPLLLWILMASGFAESFSMPEGLDSETTYSVFLLPGVMTLIVMFAAIFASMSLIQDRNEGWMQGVLVSPVPRWSIAVGKIMGGAIPAWLQGVLILLLSPILGAWPGIGGSIIILIGLALTAFALNAIGLAFAWKCDSAQEFHAVMNLLFVPLWMLSGAFFSAEGASAWLAWIVRINPLSWCTETIRSAMLNDISWLSLILTLMFAIISVVIATMVISKPSPKSMA